MKVEIEKMEMKWKKNVKRITNYRGKDDNGVSDQKLHVSEIEGNSQELRKKKNGRDMNSFYWFGILDVTIIYCGSVISFVQPMNHVFHFPKPFLGLHCPAV